MGRSPSSDENGLKKGPWTPEEDQKLIQHIDKNGHGSWRALPKLAGLNRCGKSCRLRWTNYLRPDIKRGKFSQEEEQTILHLHSMLGNKWSAIAQHLPGRTDNEIKNFWNTHLRKKLIQMGFDPMTHQPRTDIVSTLQNLIALANLRDLIEHPPLLEDHAAKLQAELIQYLIQSAASVNSIPGHTQYGITDTGIGNLLDNIIHSNIKENPVLNSPLMENQTSSLFPIENATSQLLHHSITSPPFPDPQVPFIFQTPLNTEQSELDVGSDLTMVRQGDKIPPNSEWVLSSPTNSSTLPPLTESSISNPGDASSTSSYGGSASNSWWSEMLFEDLSMHGIS